MVNIGLHRISFANEVIVIENFIIDAHAERIVVQVLLAPVDVGIMYDKIGESIVYFCRDSGQLIITCFRCQFVGIVCQVEEGDAEVLCSIDRRTVVATKYTGEYYHGQCDVSSWADIVAIAAGLYNAYPDLDYSDYEVIKETFQLAD